MTKSFTGTRRYMRYLCVPALMLSLTAAGCKGKREKMAVTVEEDAAPQVASTINMGNPRVAAQLLSGFYGIENGQWRWTAGKFSVMLKPPAGASTAGASLKFNFSLPDVITQKVPPPFTLSASINGTPLKSEQYAAAGTYTYFADVPANLLPGEAVKIDFATDKSLPPSGADKRELALIAVSAGLTAK